MKIGKRDREEAIEHLECVGVHFSIGGLFHASQEAWASLHDGVRIVAGRAFDAIPSSAHVDVATAEWLAMQYLEAAALLRDGWNPGDPVEVRRG